MDLVLVLSFRLVDKSSTEAHEAVFTAACPQPAATGETSDLIRSVPIDSPLGDQLWPLREGNFKSLDHSLEFWISCLLCSFATATFCRRLYSLLSCAFFARVLGEWVPPRVFAAVELFFSARIRPGAAEVVAVALLTSQLTITASKHSDDLIGCAV